MSKDTNELLNHAADNDGIDEYDNDLPDWWLGLFIFCIIFAFGYAVDYHFISNRSQVRAYDAEIAQAKILWPEPVAAVGGPVITPEMVDAGAEIFAANCVVCHKADLSGGIGPNLKDATWIHGGTYVEITHTITTGVPEKGMLTWGPILGPDKIAKVAAYVYEQGPKLGLEPAAAPAAVDPSGG